MSAKARKTRKGGSGGVHRRAHRGLNSEAVHRQRAAKYAPKTTENSPQKAREHRARKMKGDDQQ
jgi:hypothetical protein